MPTPNPFLARLRSQFPVRLLLIGAVLSVAVGCSGATPVPGVGVQSIPIDTQAPPATVTPIPIPAATPAPAPSADVADLPQLFADSLGITLQPDGQQWQGAEVLSVAPNLWAVFTTGFRAFDPIKNHGVAIYTKNNNAWVELGKTEVECADYVDSHSIQQVYLDTSSVWLTVDAGVGAHSGCFDLLRWDGTTLSVAVTSSNSSPGAGEVRDVDGDGQPEVVLNTSDPYVFCYACGVRLYNQSILRWDGAKLLPVELTLLPAETVADLRDANNRAVELAGASLFPVALPLIDEALGYAPSDERVYWNHQLIHALADGRKAYAGSTPYPLLNWIFYGDWDAAVGELRAFTPAQIFDPQKTMLQNTVAAGWESAVADWILQFAGPAMDAQPDLAPAWYLQGWALFLKDSSDPAVVTNVEQAARLAPNESLYRGSLEQLSGRGISQATQTPTTVPRVAIPVPATVEILRFPVGATIQELSVDLGAGEVKGYSLGITAGQKLYVTASGTVRVWLVDGANRPIAAQSDANAMRLDIPATGNYTLVLQGSGIADILLAIPPLGPPDTAAPARIERVRFAAGATSATLEPTLTRGAPIGYLLGIGAGQRLWVTAALGDASFWLLDPDGKTLSPIQRTSRVGEYAIPRTGDYTLVLDGDGSVQVMVEIPPR